MCEHCGQRPAESRVTIFGADGAVILRLCAVCREAPAATLLAGGPGGPPALLPVPPIEQRAQRRRES